MDSEFVEYALRQLQVLGPVVARRMFGAHGLYCDGRIFALIDNDALYFKVDALSRLDYVAAGMGPFAPLPGKKMDGYYELPLDVLESRAKLVQWGQKALAAAAEAQLAKPGRAARRRVAGAFAKLGPVPLRQLAAAGIRTRADLEHMGTLAAFRKLAQAGHEPSAKLLLALESVRLGLRPAQLSEAIRLNLLELAGLPIPEPRAKRRTKRAR